MSDSFIYSIIGLLLSGMGAFIMRDFIQRVKDLEMKIDKKVTEDQVRNIMNDNLGPIKEDISDIKLQLKEILNRLYKI